jgi:2-desacetyl-2-hydroxyethyl bacteriochlorophyllide A dehydrogenase
MPREIVILGPRKVGLREYQEEPLKNREIKVRTLFSGISHGTEMNIYRGTAPQFHKSVSERGLFQEGSPLFKYPMIYGYEEVGEVAEVASDVRDYKVGDVVASCYTHKELANINVDAIAPYLNIMPKGMKAERGIFLGLGTVALDALITSNIRFSESAVIFGQGVVGLLLLQLCKLAGASPVIAVDMIEKRLSMSKSLGADYALNPQTCDVASEVRGILGPGSDVVFETSGSIRALHDGIRCGAPRYSKVLAVAWYQGPAQNLYLGEEFHHGLGASHIISAGPGIHARLPASPGRQWDDVRVAKTFFRLLADGKVNVEGLISHRFSFEEADKAYDLIDKHPEDIIKVVLTFKAP